MKRHLSLRTERLGELTPDELAAVAGAGQGVTVSEACPTTRCFTAPIPTFNPWCTGP